MTASNATPGPRASTATNGSDTTIAATHMLVAAISLPITRSRRWSGVTSNDSSVPRSRSPEIASELMTSAVSAPSAIAVCTMTPTDSRASSRLIPASADTRYDSAASNTLKPSNTPGPRVLPQSSDSSWRATIDHPGRVLWAVVLVMTVLPVRSERERRR